MSSIAGTLIRGDTRPKVPTFTPIDVDEEQRLAIKGNQSNLQDAAQLAADTNEELATQWNAQLERMMPGYGAMLAKGTENIMASLAGYLPPGVEDYLQRQAAQRGVARGTSGSEFDRMGLVRDLGLTSLQITDRALGSSAQWLQAATNRTPFMDFSQMFVSPMQRVGITQWNKAMKWNRDWLHNQIRAMPNQYQEAAAGFFDTVEETGRTFLVAWGSKQAGMGGGGGGGGGGGQQQQRPIPEYSMYGSGSLVDDTSYGDYNQPAPYPSSYGYGYDGAMQPGGWGAP
jgi:hypothetical protein